MTTGRWELLEFVVERGFGISIPVIAQFRARPLMGLPVPKMPILSFINTRTWYTNTTPETTALSKRQQRNSTILPVLRYKSRTLTSPPAMPVKSLPTPIPTIRGRFDQNECLVKKTLTLVCGSTKYSPQRVSEAWIAKSEHEKGMIGA